jgi:aldehyde dehydrogenase (NAD+)
MATAKTIPLARHPYADGSYKQMLVDGRWIDAASGKRFESRNPATGEVLATVAEGDTEDVNRAVAAARKAFEGPRSEFKPYQRQQLLLKLADLVERHFDELSALDTLDMGAPISRTRGTRVLGMLRYYAGRATSIHGETIENSLPGDIFSYTLKEPVGVVGAIIPWNGPLGASVWKLGPALATGCTVVLKPAEEAPLTSLRLGELALEAGVPSGVVNIVPGYGETAGAALAAHPDVDKVAFPDRTSPDNRSFGRQRAISSACPSSLVASLRTSYSPMQTSSPRCRAPPWWCLPIWVKSAVPARDCSSKSASMTNSSTSQSSAEGFGFGNGLDPETQIGPLVSEQQLERVTGYLNLGRQEGARAIAGGERLTDGPLAQGYFVPPTVFAEVRDDMRIAKEAIFGPGLSAIRFGDVDELVTRANATMFGLGSGVWTRDVSKAHRLAKAIRAGSVWVNCYQAMDPAVPFGGYKMSGYGRESGLQHIEEYLNVKAVWIKTA